MGKTKITARSGKAVKERSNLHAGMASAWTSTSSVTVSATVVAARMSRSVQSPVFMALVKRLFPMILKILKRKVKMKRKKTAVFLVFGEEVLIIKRISHERNTQLYVILFIPTNSLMSDDILNGTE